jgi:TRAP-type C4-dicarboxylate transport system substrate-binding protein
MRSFCCAVAAGLALFCLGREAEADTIPLLFDIVGPPGSAAMTNALEPWAARVNQQAAGLIHIDVREGMALATLENIYDRVLDDAIQIGWTAQNSVAGKFPLSEVPAVPFLVRSSEAGSVAFWRLYQSGLLDAEYDQIVVLATGMLGAGAPHLSAPLKDFDDLRGLKLSAAGHMQSQTLTALGIAPISIPYTDTYLALQRKTIDGAIIGWGGVQLFKLQQVAPYHVDVSLGTSISMVFMAKKKFASLPAEAQRVLLDNSGEALSRQYGRAIDADSAAQRQRILTEPGQTVVTVPPESLALWNVKTLQVVNAWTDSRQRGNEVLEKFRSLYVAAEDEIHQPH